MNLVTLALNSIAGSAFRSVVVALCVFLVSGFALSTTLIVRGAEASLRLSQQRLGADLIVVPEGAEAKAEGALLMGKPTSLWMSADNVSKIANVPGVVVASPQIFLASMKDSSCCSASEMFIIAIDPKTDFTIRPWLDRQLGRELKIGESIGGTFVFVPPGEGGIKLYGYIVSLAGNLEPTGTGIDQTLFMTFDTARAMARASKRSAITPLEIPADQVSAVLVKIAPDLSPQAVALDVQRAIPGVTPVPTPDIYKSMSRQMAIVARGVLAILILTWALSVVFIGLLFSIAVNERRRGIGVLRALGASRGAVLQTILLEAAVLAIGGATLGIAVFGLGTYLFHNLIVRSLALPFLLPSIEEFGGMVGVGLLLAMFSVTLAALAPALRVAFQEPALAMRE